MIKKLLALLLCAGATWTLTAQTPNTDGVALLAEPAAGLECADGETDAFEPGVKLFLNRDYTLKEVPAELSGFKFIRGKIDGVYAVCREPGVVYVATPSPGRNPDSRAPALLNLGFQKASLPEFYVLPGDANLCSVYQKTMAVGESLALGQWGVIIVPQKVARGAVTAPPADAKPAEVMPALNFSPGPEYVDSARMFQGIPGIECAPNGRLWATWYGGGVTENQHNYILLYTSGDDGQTWQRVLILDPDGAGPVRAFDPCLWHDPDGKLWLTWAQSAPGQSPCLLGITTTDSGNATTNWSAPRKLCDGVMMNKPTVAADGRWLWPVARWFSDGSSRVVVSSDYGKTFTDMGAANIPDAKQRSADEHMLVERKDGTLWMLTRTGYGLGESISTDGSKTWPDMAASSIPHTVSRFFIRRLASGHLLLVRHDPPNLGKDPSLLTGNGRSHLTAFLSDDDGRTWKGGLLLDERHGVTYPDGVQAADGSIYVIYDFNRQTDKEILFAKFREEDVLAGKISSSDGRLRGLVNKATGINSAVLAAVGGNANTDGVALQTEPAAVLECAGGETDKFEPGVKLFLNRDYALKAAPAAMQGFQFIRGDIEGVHAVCRQAGVVYVLTSPPERNPDSRAALLLEQGFQKASVPDFPLFGGDLGSVYQKQVSVGDTLDFGKWGVLIVPAGS